MTEQDIRDRLEFATNGTGPCSPITGREVAALCRFALDALDVIQKITAEYPTIVSLMNADARALLSRHGLDGGAA